MVSPKDKSVGDLISECIVVEPSTLVSKAIGQMKDGNFYEVFSRLGDKIGAVTIRDILRVKNPANMRIETLLNFVPKLSLNTGLFQAARIMADHKLRALPIIENNNVIGKIDIRAIVSEVKNSSLGNIRASKIMSPSPITVLAREKVSKAREIMLRRKIDHLPVIKSRRVTGVITSAHIVFNLITDLGDDRYRFGIPDLINPLDYPVEAVMGRSQLEFDPQAPIKIIAESMLSQDSSYSLITVGEELQGILTYRDFAKLISAEEAKINFPVYIIGLPDDPFEAEAAKIKFIRLVEGINRFLPSVIEARSTIKSSSLEGQRRRCEVTVNIRTDREAYNYSTEGWDLPSIYDDMASAMKKMITTKRRIRKKRTPKNP